MTDILFVNPTEELSMKAEVNGTMLLATKLLQAGFETKILRFCQIESFSKDYSVFIRDITNRILGISPRCVSFYSLWPHYHVMLRIAQEIKRNKPETVIVFGGPQASATADATMTAMDCVDYICTGEGENTVVPFFKAVWGEDGADFAAIPGLYYRVNGKIIHNEIDTPLVDLNTLPYWDERLYADDYKEPEQVLQSDSYFMPIDAGRGCPCNCTFCCTSYFWHRTYRLKSPERIVEDIRYYNEKYGIKSFWFSHDAFTANRQLVSKVCDRLIETGLDIKWKCSARIDCITEELILKMKKAGLTYIELGVETGSQRMQKLIKKHLNLEKVKKTVDFLLENGLHVILFFMHGFPEETEQDLNETLELAFGLLDKGVMHASISFLSFNPTTAVTQQHFDELVLDPEIKILTRKIYGYQEELPMIKENKALFPFFYHLDTPLRNDYQYLGALGFLYERFPNSIRYLRSLYNGDNLRFYRDFYESNLVFFERDMEFMRLGLVEHPLEMLDNMLRKFDLPYMRQLKALLKLDFNLRKVRMSDEDISLRETYDFSYVDFKLKLPLAQYSDGKSEILLQKVNGKVSLKVIRIG